MVDLEDIVRRFPDYPRGLVLMGIAKLFNVIRVDSSLTEEEQVEMRKQAIELLKVTVHFPSGSD